MNSPRSTTGDWRRFAVHEIAAHGVKLRGVSFGWHWSREGKTQASIGASVQGGEDGATLVLNYMLNGSPVAQRIRLGSSPCRFGGVRWLALRKTGGRARRGRASSSASRLGVVPTRTSEKPLPSTAHCSGVNSLNTVRIALAVARRSIVTSPPREPRIPSAFENGALPPRPDTPYPHPCPIRWQLCCAAH